MSKFKAKQVWYSHALNRPLLPNELVVYQNQKSRHPLSLEKLGEVTKFDSQLEFKVFLTLQQSHLVSKVIPHHPLEIIPPNKSKCFPNGRQWKADFLVKGHHKEILMIVEAKGIISRDFPMILANFEQNKPELFKKLWLVFDRIPRDNRLVKNLQKSSLVEVVTLREFRDLIT